MEDNTEKIKKRGLRREKTERKHEQRKKYYHWSNDFPTKKVFLETPKRKSTCRCCGNPRKYEKGKITKSIQELRHEPTKDDLD